MNLLAVRKVSRLHAGATAALWEGRPCCCCCCCCCNPLSWHLVRSHRHMRLECVSWSSPECSIKEPSRHEGGMRTRRSEKDFIFASQCPAAGRRSHRLYANSLRGHLFVSLSLSLCLLLLEPLFGRRNGRNLSSKIYIGDLARRRNSCSLPLASSPSWLSIWNAG